MIDFRFHLISIVAVFLALGLGILMGSGFVGDLAIKNLNDRIESVREQNSEYRTEIDELEKDLRVDHDFMSEVRAQLVEDSLTARPVVLLQFDGIDGGVRDELDATVEEAGGRVVTVLTFTEKFALPGAPERDQLSFIVGPSVGTPEELLDQAGSLFGFRAAAAAEPDRDQPTRADAFAELATELEESGFVDIDADGDGDLVPRGAAFLVIGGNQVEPPFDAARLLTSLTSSMADRDAAVLVAEPSRSEWGLVAAIRDGDETRAEVATVDQIETIPGLIAAVVGLGVEARSDGSQPAGHYGTGDGATDLYPGAPAG